MVGVSRYDASVEPDIDPALASAGLELFVKALDGRGGGDGVERHVDDGGHASRGGSSGARPETLPLCPTWLVEVNVGIDEARQEQPRTMVHIDCRCGEIVSGNHARLDSDNLARLGGDGDGGRADHEGVVWKSEDGTGRGKDVKARRWSRAIGGGGAHRDGDEQGFVFG